MVGGFSANTSVKLSPAAWPQREGIRTGRSEEDCRDRS
jgi:hypothetical protein